MLIEVFLNAVYVFNDKIVISCNYKDGTKTVNFSEMESALSMRASISGSDLDCPGAPGQSKSEPTLRSAWEERERGFTQLRIQNTETHAYDTSKYDFGGISLENAKNLFRAERR